MLYHVLSFFLFFSVLWPSDLPKQKPLKKGEVLKVMTYNIRHGNSLGQAPEVVNLEPAAAAINAQNPHLVALQELDVHNRRSGLEVNQAKELGRLTNMHFYFAKLRDYQGGEYGVAILSKFPLLEASTHELPITGGEKRALAVVAVQVSKKQKLYFASAHYDLKEENRSLQVEETLALSRKVKAPFILAGDLNAKPDSPTLARLQSNLKMLCQGDGCPFTFPANAPNRSIDFIMLNPEAQALLEPISYQTAHEPTASDHLPLVTELRLKE